MFGIACWLGNLRPFTGASGFGARSITALVWRDKHPPFIVTIYVSQTDASMDRRNLTMVEIGKSIFDLFTDSAQA
ncbi:hypothetical protein BA953_24740 (plasmid) [Vibrio coralliilyticus]|nr:hypothetical protein BA953_24740 [Vibrio coralliilyticus]